MQLLTGCTGGKLWQEVTSFPFTFLAGYGFWNLTIIVPDGISRYFKLKESIK